MKKIKISDLWERVAKGEPVYINDVCDTDAAYMIMGEFTMVKYTGKTPFRIETSEASAQNAILCGQEITEDEFNNF